MNWLTDRDATLSQHHNLGAPNAYGALCLAREAVSEIMNSTGINGKWQCSRMPMPHSEASRIVNEKMSFRMGRRTPRLHGAPARTLACQICCRASLPSERAFVCGQRQPGPHGGSDLLEPVMPRCRVFKSTGWTRIRAAKAKTISDTGGGRFVSDWRL